MPRASSKFLSLLKYYVPRWKSFRENTNDTICVRCWVTLLKSQLTSSEIADIMDCYEVIVNDCFNKFETERGCKGYERSWWRA
jgi:hypothetical protein